jgi:hypothetical protein
VPDYFARVLQRIESLFDKPVVIDDFDEEWLHFHIPGLIDSNVIREIEARQDDILPGSELHDHQILCASTPADGRGLWIHALDGLPDRDDYLSGVWFF